MVYDIVRKIAKIWILTPFLVGLINTHFLEFLSKKWPLISIYCPNMGLKFGQNYFFVSKLKKINFQTLFGDFKGVSRRKYQVKCPMRHLRMILSKTASISSPMKLQWLVSISGLHFRKLHDILREIAKKFGLDTIFGQPKCSFYKKFQKRSFFPFIVPIWI